MKKLILVTFIMAAMTAVTAFAGNGGTLEKDQNVQLIQGAAPNGFLSQILTVNSTTIDMRTNLWWGMYTPSTTATCKFRILPSTSKGSYPAFTAPGGERVAYVVHNLTRYVNYSGCTNSELMRF